MHVHEVTIYYEDTDFSGMVYHANYLKYFERAREHLIGVDELRRMWREDGVGFAVYKAELTFRVPAFHGDRLQIRTTYHVENPWRITFDQSVWRSDEPKALVQGSVDLVCTNTDGKLIRLPVDLSERLIGS